jgi:hypothetical protein
MPQTLFHTPKLGVILEGYAPAIEKRRGEEVKVVSLKLRVEAFDAELASSIDAGLGGDSGVRALLFNLTDGEQKPHLDGAALSLGCPRQTLRMFAAPDIDESRIAFAQVKISGTTVVTNKETGTFVFKFKASYGPVGRDELEYFHQWYQNTLFVTFEEAEPGLFDEAPEEADPDAEQQVIDGRGLSVHAPQWDDGDLSAEARDAGEEGDVELEDEHVREVGAVPIKARGTKKKAGRHDPEQERKAQTAAGKATVQ